MIILGIVLLVLGFVLSIPVLWTIGIILIAVGAVLMILGATGRAVAGASTGTSRPAPARAVRCTDLSTHKQRVPSLAGVAVRGEVLSKWRYRVRRVAVAVMPGQVTASGIAGRR